MGRKDKVFKEGKRGRDHKARNKLRKPLPCVVQPNSSSSQQGKIKWLQFPQLFGLRCCVNMPAPHLAPRRLEPREGRESCSAKTTMNSAVGSLACLVSRSHQRNSTVSNFVSSPCQEGSIQVKGEVLEQSRSVPAWKWGHGSQIIPDNVASKFVTRLLLSLWCHLTSTGRV